MQKTAIDAVGIDRYGGGRTAVLNLLVAMFELEQRDSFHVLLSEHESALDSFPNVRQHVMRFRGRFAVRAYLQWWLPRFVRREGIDLVHFTKNLGVIGLTCPYIVTVHDLTTLLLAGQHTPFDVLYWRLVEPWTVRNAARVVAVSRDAAHDIERFFGVPQPSVEVVYWAPDRRFVAPRDSALIADWRRQHGLPRRYILFVGILAKKKNLPTLLRSLAVLRSRLADVPELVIVGRPYPQSDDMISKSLLSELGLTSIAHFIGSVPDDDLPFYYAGAEMYVLPSLHEGFGIPLLEAMACGTPVITTSAGALPEIAGDAALVVTDPLDVHALACAIEQVMHDDQLRREMVRRGYRRSAMFSWERSAQKMLEIYRAAAGQEL